MDSVLKTLKAIELEHRWWSPEIFLRLDNQTLKRKVTHVIQTDPYCKTLSRDGTREEIEAFKDALHEQTPLMIISVLTCFLDYLFQQEQTGGSISSQIVKWYRNQGWQFPKFTFEER